MPLLELSFASGESSLSVRRFAVREGVSTCFTLSVWSRSPNPSIDLESIVGKPASFRVESGFAFALLGGARLWTGICSYFEQTQVEPTGLSTYFLRIVPSLWLLTQRRNHRIFQHLSIPDIVDKLLAEWSIDPVWKIDRASYPKLEIRIQYGESDYDFLNRLLEEAGIAFTLPDEGARGTKLTLDDRLHESEPRETPPVPYVDNPNQAAEREFVTRVRLGHEVRPGAHTIRDHDFRKPAYALLGEAPKARAPEDRYEQFHYAPGAFLIETDKHGDTPIADDRGIARHNEKYGDGRADRTLAAERTGKQGVTFDTNVVDLCPGVVFSIDGHAHPDADGKKLLVTEMSFEGAVDGEWSLSGHAVPAAAPYRPAQRTPKPRIRNVQSATVVGPAGEEIHTDEFGRVRVQLPWDREGKSDDKSSCWMRVSQGWAGGAYGMMHIPRIGQEVLIAFLDGNPDQPVVVGRVYNQRNPAPYELPERKTRSTWKSDSSPGSGGLNVLLFEDAKDDELVSLQAERNLRRLVKHDEALTVGHDREKQVQRNETDTTVVNRTEVTGADRMQSIGAALIQVVGADRTRLVKGNEAERVEVHHLLRAGKDRHALVKGEKREIIEEDSHLRVKGNRNKQVGGTLSLGTTSLQVKVGKDHALEAGDEIHLASNEALIGEAAADLTIAGPGGFIRIDAGGVTIKGTLVKINVGGSPGSGSGASPVKPEGPMEAAFAEILKGPHDGSKTSKNHIDIVFDPAQSTKVKACAKIVHVQVTQVFVDGKAVMPGSYSPMFKFRDKTALPNGSHVDHLPPEVTPDYQQGKGDGKKNGGTTKATMSDTPQSSGGTQGFYHATTNPGGIKEYKAKFETFAYCLKGPDCGTWYEGVKWEYTKTWEDKRDGKTGTSTITNNNIATPSQNFLDAFDKFNKDKGFTPCK